MTPSIQHYHVEVDISAIEISLTHNCSHLTQAYFNLISRAVLALKDSAIALQLFISTSGVVELS